MINLTVVIPTRNRSALLRQTLQSIVEQTYDKQFFEVIVVDNGSIDDTKACVESFKKVLPNIRYHYDDRPGLHVGRHAGYKLAQSDILVYADDDIIAFPTWLEAINENFQNPEVVLVGGKDLPKYEVEPPFWIKEKWYDISIEGHCVSDLSLIDLGDKSKPISPGYVFGCNFSVRKSLITETQGFHPDGMPFEKIHLRGDGETYVTNYIREHGYLTMYDPRASVYHMVPQSRMTVDYFKKRSFCRGVELSYIQLRQQALYPVLQPKHFRKIRRWVNSILHSRKNNLTEVQVTATMTDIEKQIILSEHMGYNYHQNMYHRDQKLREWVARMNYLD